MNFALKSDRIVTPQGTLAGCVLVRDEKIEAVLTAEAMGDLAANVPVEDVSGLVVMPGLVDTHVHINEPGRTEWEGFDTATRAAAAGGVTTLVDMPLNCIPATTSVSALRAKLAAARGRIHVDCGFYGGLIPGNEAELDGLMAAGVLGFKSFLIDSGVDEFPHVREVDLRRGLPLLARRGVPLLAHAELDLRAPENATGDPRHYDTYLRSRPVYWETDAIDLMIRLSEEFGARVHIVHLSAARALPALEAARSRNLRVSVETCHHYLSFAAEEIPDGRTEFKCAPPIRERANREALWAGLRTGQIDFAVSDHSPCIPRLKTEHAGDFLKAWGGIAGLQFSLSAFYSAGRDRGVGPGDLAPWLAAAPADFAGLGLRKGRIAPGYDADLVVWDPAAEFVVRPEEIFQRYELTPYAGRSLFGKVRSTYLRGRPIFRNGSFPETGRGAILA